MDHDADSRKCMQESNRTYENHDKLGQCRKRTWENQQKTPQQKQDQFGNHWNVIQTTAAGRPNTIPTRQHPELGQAHRARINYQSVQRATASQAGSSCTQTQWPRKNYSSERDQESCDLSGEVQNNTPHSESHHMFSVAQRIQVFFCQFSSFFWRYHVLSIGCEEVELGWKQDYLRCAEKHVSVVSHLFQFFIYFTDTDGTVKITPLPSTSPLPPRS